MIVVAALIAALLILIMVKLSELNGRLTTIQADVQALKESVGDPAIPAEAEATLNAIDALLHPPAPPPAG